jgi:hypothetical protein
MINFASIKKPPRVYPNFKIISHHTNRYKGIGIKKYTHISFPKIDKPVGINFFQQVYPSETQHSMILGELLSPNGQHNRGYTFLELFFKNVIKDIPFNNKDTWIVTVEKERYDIRIRNLDNSTIIILENKSNQAGDQPNQLYRYWYHGIYGIQNKIKANKTKYGKILYISPRYGKEPDDQTQLPPKELLDLNLVIPNNVISTIYFQKGIDKWLEECLNVVVKDSDIFYYLKQYKDFWRFYYVV